MAIHGPGSQITMSQIVTEFGGSTPHSLSEYYRGGSYVPSGPAANNRIATSGAISMGAFYGATKMWYGTIGANQVNLNLRSWATSAGWDGSTPATITISSGIYIYSTSTDTPALTTGSFPGGITLINNGYIIGCGGAGGGSSGYSTTWNATAGGHAISLSGYLTLDNTNGYVFGGGGGGANRSSVYNTSAWGRSGGGGGAGVVSAGGGQSAIGVNYWVLDSHGATGGYWSGGDGGQTHHIQPHYLYGGTGGGNGTAGNVGSGGAGGYSNYDGAVGAAGYAIINTGYGLNITAGNNSSQIKGPVG